ncbi:MAG: SHOCT domain-containing protein [Humibacter sp.]
MAARTAVVAGTATAVSGGVMRHQQKRADEKYEQQQYEAEQAAAAQQQYAQPQYAPPQQYAAPEQQYAPAPEQAQPAAPAQTDMVTELERLAKLKEQGVLSDAEFEAAKTKLLG